MTNEFWLSMRTVLSDNNVTHSDLKKSIDEWSTQVATILKKQA